MKYGLYQLYSNIYELKQIADLKIFKSSNQGGMGMYRSGTYTEACGIYPCTA